MISRRAVSAGAVALILASITIKVTLADRAPADDERALLHAVTAALRTQGFATAANLPVGYVVAQRGDCRLKLRHFAPYGFGRSWVEDRGASFGVTRYAYRGVLTADPPKTRPLLLFYLQREFARLDITLPRAAIVAVAGAGTCPGFDPRWVALPIVQRDAGAHASVE